MTSPTNDTSSPSSKHDDQPLRTPRLSNRSRRPQRNKPSYTETKAFELIEKLTENYRSEKRWRRFRNIFILGFITLITASCVFQIQQGLDQIVSYFNQGVNPHMSGDSEFSYDEHLAVIPLVGIISEADVSANYFNQRLKNAFENNQAKAVLIHANSPGGSPVQSALINDAIVRLKKSYSKPVYAVVSDVCASGCYYAIANADNIIVNASSIIGSIGVKLQSFDLRELMQKIGIKQRLLTAGKNKAILDPFGDFPKKEKLFLQELIKDAHQEFIKVVEQGRGNKLQADKDTLYSGLIWSGHKGIALGLADELGDLETVSQQLGGLPLEYYASKFTFFEEFLNSLARFFNSSSIALKTLW